VPPNSKSISTPNSAEATAIGGVWKPPSSVGVDVTDQLRTLSARLDEVRAEQTALNQATEPSLRAALATFTPLWEHLYPRERERILRLLIERITYHPDAGDVDIELRPNGIEALAAEAEA
jgi:hypothetical protein